MTHLLNQLAHFPMAGSAARMSSAVRECHDLVDYSAEELTSQLFEAPTVQVRLTCSPKQKECLNYVISFVFFFQFFVLNNLLLLTFVEVPAQVTYYATSLNPVASSSLHRCSLVLQVNEAGGGATGGLNSVSTVTRLVIRDACGRYCWDNSILYGSNPTASNSSKTATSASDSHASNTDTELRTRSPSDKPQTSSFEVDDVILEAPVFGSVHSNRDTLDQVRTLFFF